MKFSYILWYGLNTQMIYKSIQILVDQKNPC